MGKKILFSIILLLALFPSFSSAAMAKANFDLDTPFTVYTANGTSEYQTFQLNETPYGYAHVTNANDEKLFKMSWQWYYEDVFVGSLAHSALKTGETNFSFWNAETDADWETKWGSEVKAGSWKLKTSWEHDGYLEGIETSFTVTPEPISTVLFLVGGLPLGASLLRKKFKV